VKPAKDCVKDPIQFARDNAVQVFDYEDEVDRDADALFYARERKKGRLPRPSTQNIKQFKRGIKKRAKLRRQYEYLFAPPRGMFMLHEPLTVGPRE